MTSTRPHGTHARYVVDRCHCTPCRAANRAYEANRTRQILYGRWQPYVDAAPARTHVRALMAYGIGWKRVAHLAGVPITCVNRLLYGIGDRKPSVRIRPGTQAALLAVQPSLDLLAPAVRVDATGSRRRLQALVRIGWSKSKLASRLGMQVRNLGWAFGAGYVAAGTARKVLALYEELWDQPPAEETHRDKIAASRARRYAADRDWPAPMDWDDDLIDVPDQQLAAEIEQRVEAMDDREIYQICRAAYDKDETTLYSQAAGRERYRRRKAKQREDVAS
jgi:hypothetical protein